MSNQHIVSIPVAKPKVFRPPPAPPSSAPRRLPVRSAKKWRLTIFALIILGPAAIYLTTHNRTKNNDLSQVENDALEGVLQPPVADAQAAMLTEKPPTIMLRGQSEAIIGQMAQIPSENEPIVETRAVSNVDNNTARALLSIVSKY